MIALLAALIFTSPIPTRHHAVLKHCITSCHGYVDEHVCYYERFESCGTAQVCINSKARTCRPLRVFIGEWDPVPEDYEPEGEASWSGKTNPDSFISHLNDTPDAVPGYPAGTVPAKTDVQEWQHPTDTEE